MSGSEHIAILEVASTVNGHDDARETVSDHGHFLGGRVEEIHGDMKTCFSLREEKRTQA